MVGSGSSRIRAAVAGPAARANAWICSPTVTETLGIVTSIFAASVFEAADQSIGRFALLFSPFDVLQGLTLWFFDVAPDPGTQLAEADLPGVVYAIDAILVTLLMLALLFRRYERISP